MNRPPLAQFVRFLHQQTRQISGSVCSDSCKQQMCPVIAASIPFRSVDTLEIPQAICFVEVVTFSQTSKCECLHFCKSDHACPLEFPHRENDLTSTATENKTHASQMAVSIRNFVSLPKGWSQIHRHFSGVTDLEEFFLQLRFVSCVSLFIAAKDRRFVTSQLRQRLDQRFNTLAEKIFQRHHKMLKNCGLFYCRMKLIG